MEGLYSYWQVMCLEKETITRIAVNFKFYSWFANFKFKT